MNRDSAKIYNLYVEKFLGLFGKEKKQPSALELGVLAGKRPISEPAKTIQHYGKLPELSSGSATTAPSTYQRPLRAYSADTPKAARPGEKLMNLVKADGSSEVVSYNKDQPNVYFSQRNGRWVPQKLAAGERLETEELSPSRDIGFGSPASFRS